MSPEPRHEGDYSDRQVDAAVVVRVGRLHARGRLAAREEVLEEEHRIGSTPVRNRQCAPWNNPLTDRRTPAYPG